MASILAQDEMKCLQKALTDLEASYRRASKSNGQIEMVAKGFVTEADAVQMLRLKLVNQKVSVG